MRKIALVLVGCILVLSGCGKGTIKSSSTSSQKAQSSSTTSMASSTTSEEVFTSPASISPNRETTIFIKNSVSRELLIGTLKDNTMSIKNTGIMGGVCFLFNDWVYYTNNDYDEILQIYKMKIDGSQRTKVDNLTNLNIFDAEFSNGYLYFTKKNDRKLYKIQLENIKVEKISDQKIMYMKIDGEWIYYTINDESTILYKIKTDGTQLTKLCEGIYIRELSISKDKVYFISSTVWDTSKNSYNIFQMNTDGTDKKQICASGDYVIDNNFLYANLSDTETINHLTNIYLSRIDLNTLKVSRICKCDVNSNMTVYNNWIIGIGTYDNMWAISLDGKRKIKLSTDLVDEGVMGYFIVK